MTEAALGAVRHYLGRARALVEIATEADLTHRPAPDMFAVGDQLAVAIGFAGRAVLPLAGRDVPKAPQRNDRATLIGFADTMAAALAGVRAADLGRNEVAHRAGFADLTQAGDDYLVRFALPNMVFHLTAAYIGLKRAGRALGKADFDALHAYPEGFSFEHDPLD